MFDTRKQFAYWECCSCGCMQIAQIPENLGEFYPAGYYSFSEHLTPWHMNLYRLYFKAPRLVGLFRKPGVALQAVVKAKPRPGAKILDVGCGDGKIVKILRNAGFDAHGIDLFITSETPYVRQATLQEVTKGWDLIMFHHSLEHMTDHLSVLRSAREKLNAGGMCLVRIPVINWAWQHYGENWMQLDVPRHLTLHTPKSFRLACESVGFRIVQTVFDSSEYQFSVSEMYRRKSDPNLQANSEAKRTDKGQMRRWRNRAADLNRQGLGDQAAFYLEATGQ